MTTIMQLSVAEIKKMKDDGLLHFNHSTQRGFLYNDSADYARSKEDPELTCAGDVVKTILEDGDISPVVFFKVNGMADNEYNVHDGKQRLYSVLEFIEGNVITKLADGKPVSFGWLLTFKPELVTKLFEFIFDIQVRYGDENKEERSFFKTNTTGIPLTEYEGLKGSYHGEFFDTFETWIEKKHLSLPDSVESIGRGRQAIWYLYLALNCIDTDGDYTGSDPKVYELLESARNILALCRNTKFNSATNNFEAKFNLYCRLIKEGKLHKGDAAKQASKVYRLANYIINNNLDQDKIVAYYATYNNDKYPNDIGSWKTMKEHKHAISMLLSGRTPDPLRYFSNWKPFRQAKINLWEKLGSTKICPGYTTADGVYHACGDVLKNIDDTEMDHIIPYDLGMEAGGCTSLTNVQLICGPCNSKKNKY